MLARTFDGNPALLRTAAPIAILPGDLIEADATPLGTDIDDVYPVLQLAAQEKVTPAPRIAVGSDLDWIVSLLEAAPPTPSLLGIVDPESLSADLPASSDIDQRYHTLNGRLIADAVAPYWGPTEPVAGRAASPGVKHYGRIRGQRVRRTLLVPYDSRIARTIGFHGFSLTAPRDIAPIRLLSVRGDRLLAAAHEAAHMLEPLVGIWPQQEHLSECFADAFAVLAIRTRADATEFSNDMTLYRDMRLASLLWGGSAHATGLAVVKALKATPATAVPALAEQALRIAQACVGKSDARLRRCGEWLDAARKRARLMPNCRFDEIHLTAYRERLDSNVGTPTVRAHVKRALRALNRIAVTGSRITADIRVARVFRADLARLLDAAETREQAHLALDRTRHALDSGLPRDLRHSASCAAMTDLMRLRTLLLDEASIKADALPSAKMAESRNLPTVIHVRRNSGYESAIDLSKADPSVILNIVADLLDGENAALSDAGKGCRADRELAAARAGRLLRKRVDLSIAVASDRRLLRAVHQLDKTASDEIIHLASAPLSLLIRHKGWSLT